MRINIKKIIPFVLLIFLLIWFFETELKTFYYFFAAKLTNNTIEISDMSLPHFSYGFTNPAKVSFIVNKGINEIDLNKSAISIVGTTKTIDSNIQDQLILTESVRIIDKFRFNSESVTLKQISSRLSQVSFTYDKNISKGYIFTPYIDLYDTSNNHAFEFAFSFYTANWFEVFVGNYSYLLQYLIWFFAIFGASLKPSTYSTVYDSKSKLPISRAVVRIFSNGTLITSTVTGQTGVIYTKLNKGEYTISVVHPDYTFPSNLLQQIVDGEYKNLYYGKVFSIEKNNSSLKLNIPMDSENENNKGGVIIRVGKGILSTIDTFNPYLLAIVALSQIIFWYNYLESWIYGVIGTSLILIQYLFRIKNTKGMGIAMDTKGKPISNIKIDLYDGKWDRLMESKTTDQNGEYQFIVANGNYYLKIDNSNYKLEGVGENQRISIPFKKGRKTLMINQKIVLEQITTT